MSTRTTRAAAGVLLAAALTTAAACSSDSSTTTEGTSKPSGTTAGSVAPKTGVVVSDAWCRESPMVSGAGACYAVITNNTDEDDGLVGVAVPPEVAGSAEIHETTAATTDGTDMTKGTDMTEGTDMSGDDMSGDDMMVMREVDEIEVPAGESVELKPGGYHIMLIDLAGQLVEGETVELTLDFHESGEQTVNFEVRAS